MTSLSTKIRMVYLLKYSERESSEMVIKIKNLRELKGVNTTAQSNQVYLFTVASTFNGFDFL